MAYLSLVRTIKVPTPPCEVSGIVEQRRRLAVPVTGPGGDVQRSTTKQVTVMTGQRCKSVESAAPLLLPAPASGTAPGLGAQRVRLHQSLREETPSRQDRGIDPVEGVVVVGTHLTHNRCWRVLTVVLTNLPAEV